LHDTCAKLIIRCISVDVKVVRGVQDKKVGDNSNYDMVVKMEISKNVAGVRQELML